MIVDMYPPEGGGVISSVSYLGSVLEQKILFHLTCLTQCYISFNLLIPL